MDENPCGEVADSRDEDVAFYGTLALNALMFNNVEGAEAWLRCIPRARRGRVFRAADDLQMLISRMGNDAS